MFSSFTLSLELIKSKRKERFSESLHKLKLHYQIFTTLSGGFLIGSPSFTSNAFQNSGMLLNGPLTLYLPGECGSVFNLSIEALSRTLFFQTCAQERKNLCAGVNPSIFSLFLYSSVFLKAVNATVSPPRSANVFAGSQRAINVHRIDRHHTNQTGL